jgi:hypothetical protein
MTQLLIAATHLLLSSWQYNLGPDRSKRSHRHRSSCTSVPLRTPFSSYHHYLVAGTVPICLASPEQSALPISHQTFHPVQWHFAVQSERYQIEMLLVNHWLTCCCCFDEQCILFCESKMVRVIHAGWFQRSALYLGMDSNISHSNECIIRTLILCDILTLIVPHIHPAFVYPIFFAKGSYFHLNAEPADLSLALCHNLTDLPPTHINSSHHHLISLPACCASKQELLSSWKKRGAMAVTSGLLGLNNT